MKEPSSLSRRFCAPASPAMLGGWPQAASGRAPAFPTRVRQARLHCWSGPVGSLSPGVGVAMAKDEIATAVASAPGCLPRPGANRRKGGLVGGGAASAPMGEQANAADRQQGEGGGLGDAACNRYAWVGFVAPCVRFELYPSSDNANPRVLRTCASIKSNTEALINPLWDLGAIGMCGMIRDSAFRPRRAWCRDGANNGPDWQTEQERVGKTALLNERGRAASRNVVSHGAKVYRLKERAWATWSCDRLGPRGRLNPEGSLGGSHFSPMIMAWLSVPRVTKPNKAGGCTRADCRDADAREPALNECVSSRRHKSSPLVRPFSGHSPVLPMGYGNSGKRRTQSCLGHVFLYSDLLLIEVRLGCRPATHRRERRWLPDHGAWRGGRRPRRSI